MDVGRVKEVVDRLFADTSVDAETTKDRLEDVADHIKILIESLDAD